MTTNISGSAKIYAFPPRGRFCRQLGKLLANLANRVLVQDPILVERHDDHVMFLGNAQQSHGCTCRNSSRPAARTKCAKSRILDFIRV